MPSMAEATDRVTLNPNSYADAIKMILKNFLKMKSPKKSSAQSGSLVIDIQILAERDFYIVQITHCGQWSDVGVENLLDEFCSLVKNGRLPKKTALAYIFERADGEENETAYRIQGAPDFITKRILSEDKFVHFPSFKNYVLIKLLYKLLPNHLLELREILLQEFDVLKTSHRDVKIMFYFENDIFYNNVVGADVDFQNCKLLSLPLIAVIKQSMNNQFKERCLETLGANSVHDAQKVLTRTLFSMINENYMIP